MAKVDVKINLVQLILIVLAIILLFGSGFKFHTDKVSKINKELADEVRIKEALLDKVNSYITKEGEWVSEKRTLQVEVSDIKTLLNDTVINLTATQRELLENIKALGDKNNVITAALIKTQLKLDSLIHNGVTIVDTTNNAFIFTDKFLVDTKEFSYGITIMNAVPFPRTEIPILRFDSLFFPNKEFIEFHWEKDKKLGYPITFTVKNSNGFFRTTDIDSYAIPNIVKTDLNPNFWQKIDNFMGDNKKTLIGVGAGVVAGGTLFWFITK